MMNCQEVAQASEMSIDQRDMSFTSIHGQYFSNLCKSAARNNMHKDLKTRLKNRIWDLYHEPSLFRLG